MNLQQALNKILTDWPAEKSKPFRDNALALFIRSEFPEIIRKILEPNAAKFKIVGSAGAGNWASVPWLAILDKGQTETTQKGIYPVFLFREDMSGVYLSFNQGTTEPINQMGRSAAMEQAEKLVDLIRSKLPEFGNWTKTIELRSQTPLGSSYEKPNIGARLYEKDRIPSSQELEADLRNMVALYEKAKVYASPIFPNNSNPVMHNFLPKPFLILAGISGTGKTKWVRDRAVPGKGNVVVVPVRPDWHEPSDLLGYVSRISGEPKFVPTRFLQFLLSAWRDSWTADQTLNPSASALEAMTPFWLCLDEMNLAPVEQYFADYLSVLEQREWAGGCYLCPPLLSFEPGVEDAVRVALGLDAGDHLWTAFRAVGGIPLPPNLVVVGTVNMDETTHGFSRKVLDRALTVELDSVDFGLFGGTPAAAATAAVPWSKLSSAVSASDVGVPESHRGAALGLLEKWNGIFDGTAFRIAYRTINESLLIAASLAERPPAETLDWIATSKLLPRLEGDEDKLGLGRDGSEATLLDAVADDWRGRFGEAWDGSRAKRKLEFMSARLRRSGFTTYWP